MLIIDDIDRCSHRVAQEFTTLLRRFADVPGLIIVVPYVHQQIHYKVFDPVMTVLPDLAASAEAHLWERHASSDISTYKSDLDAWFRQEKERARTPPAAGSIGPASGSDGDSEQGKMADEGMRLNPSVGTFANEAARYRTWRRSWLLEQHERLDPEERRDAETDLARKFLLSTVVRFAPLTAVEVQQIMRQSEEFMELISYLVTLIVESERKDFERGVFNDSEDGIIARALTKPVMENSNLPPHEQQWHRHIHGRSKREFRRLLGDLILDREKAENDFPRPSNGLRSGVLQASHANYVIVTVCNQIWLMRD